MTVKILLAVISREEGATISPFCALNLAQLAGARDADGQRAIDIRIQPSPYDVVRARSVAAACALEQDFTHLWFWDADVSLEDPPDTLHQMLALEEDVVFTAYRKKREPEVEMPFTTLDEYPPNRKKHGVEIAGCAMGCTLISRACLQRMWDATRPFFDKWGGVPREPHAMFMLRHVGKELLSEDYSFCFTWREMGGTIWLNLASSANHYGAHMFKFPATVEG